MSKIVAEYDYYTLDQARKIILAESRHRRLIRKRKLQEQRNIKIQFIQQRMYAAAIIVLTTVISFLENDMTAAFFLIPAGIYGLCTKRLIFK